MLNGDIVKAVWAGVAAVYGTRIIPKSTAVEMKLVGVFLEQLGVQDSVSFMRRYTTTIARNIYVPFEVGVGSQWELFAQLVTCAHEHEHVIQSDRDQDYESSYLLDQVARATYEAEAYRSSMEMSVWAGIRWPTPEHLAGKLKDYMCGPAAIEHARKFLAMSEPGIKMGMLVNEATRVTVLEMERCGLRRGFMEG